MPAPARDDVFSILRSMQQRLDRLEQTVNSTTDPRGKVTGELMLWPWDTVPAGYLLCDGSGLESSTALDLFNMLVDAGSPHGTDAFGNPKLPDYRGMTLMGAGHGTAVAGLTDHPLNTYFGAESTVLTVAQMPSHTHTIPGKTNSTAADQFRFAQAGPTGTNYDLIETGSEGGDQAHSNFQPSVTVNILVKT